MPLYEFIDNNTGEQFTKMMSISDREQFLINNPNIQSVIGAPALISGTGYQKKQDSGWKENLDRIASAHPNSALAERVKGKSIKESKVSKVSKKYGLSKKGSYDMKGL